MIPEGFVKYTSTKAQNGLISVNVRPAIVWGSAAAVAFIESYGGAYDVLINAELNQVLLLVHGGGSYSVWRPGTKNTSLRGCIGAFKRIGVSGRCEGQGQGNTILFQGPVNNHE